MMMMRMRMTTMKGTSLHPSTGVRCLPEEIVEEEDPVENGP
jgi:hypothetical protein